MEPLLVIIVLCSATMHASWNALIKMGEDRLLAMAVVITITALLSPILILTSPIPAMASWPYLLASVLLNNAYFFFLIEAYRSGDLSHAYPLARGSAPLLVAGGGALFASEHLNLVELIGVAIVSTGIVSLIAARNSNGVRGWRSVFYPLATGVMIATYTVVDGIGVRLSGSPTGYIGWLFLLFAIPIAIIAARARRGQVRTFLRHNWKSALGAGVLNFSSYGLAIFALSLGAMAHVSALRETSVILAVLIGTRVLGEPFGPIRLAAACLVTVGVITIHLGASA